jgi:hypothetical protein
MHDHGLNKDMVLPTVPATVARPADERTARGICSPRKLQHSSPTCKRSACIVKPQYDPLAPQNSRRAAELRAKYKVHKTDNHIDLEEASKHCRHLAPAWIMMMLSDEDTSLLPNQDRLCRQ